MVAEQWQGIRWPSPGHPIHVWCPSVFTTKFAPNCPTGSWTNRIYLVTHVAICLLRRCPQWNGIPLILYIMDKTISTAKFGIFMVTPNLITYPGSRKLPIRSRISVLLQNIPPFSKGGQQWQEAAAKQLKCWVNKVFAKLQYSAPLPYLWIQMASVGRYLPEYTSYFAQTHTQHC